MWRQHEWAEVWAGIVQSRAQREAHHFARVLRIDDRVHVTAGGCEFGVELMLVIRAHLLDSLAERRFYGGARLFSLFAQRALAMPVRRLSLPPAPAPRPAPPNEIQVEGPSVP